MGVSIYDGAFLVDAKERPTAAWNVLRVQSSVSADGTVLDSNNRLGGGGGGV